MPLLGAETSELGQELFRPPFREFQLQRIELGPGADPVPLAQSGAAVIIVVSGSVLLDSPKGDLRLDRGASAFLPAAEAPVNVHAVSGARHTRPGLRRHHRLGLTSWTFSCRARSGPISSAPWAAWSTSSQGPDWSFLAVEESNPAGKLLYAPYGPVAGSLEAFDAALAALTDLARRCGAVFVRIEPVSAGLDAAGADAVLRSRGLRPAPANQQPELSWIVDLDRDLKDVLADMKPANRNLYRNIHKKGVTFRSSQDPAEISVLLDFLHMTAARNGFKPQSDEYLSQVARSLMPAGAAKLFIAELEGDAYRGGPGL